MSESRTPPSVPPIVQLAERLLREIEVAVRSWPRYHKYTHGTRLREQAFSAATHAHQAWREPARRGLHVQTLAQAVDALKLSLQLGQQLKCFASFGQFEAIARVAAELGRQVGGWRKQNHPKGQHESVAQDATQRAQVLSSRAATVHAEAQR